MNSSRAIQLPTFHKIMLWKSTENTKKRKGQQQLWLGPLQEWSGHDQEAHQPQV